MRLNDFNTCTLDYVHPFNRNSQHINAILVYYKLKGTNTKVKKTFNIHQDNETPSRFLLYWLKKMKMDISNFDFNDPRKLSKEILRAGKSKDTEYDVFLVMSKNELHINIEDIKLTQKQ